MAGRNLSPIKVKGDDGMSVVFINDKGSRVEKKFDSEYLCSKFVNKLKRSKKCVLVSYPLFK